METRVVGGQNATNRAGAAERLGIALATVKRYSTPGQRGLFGFPEPLPDRVHGQDWFALSDLDDYAKTRMLPAGPTVTHPRQLTDVAELARLRGIKSSTVRSYVRNSLVEWDNGRDGYLPRPDVIDHGGGPHGGTVYQWQRGKIAQWAFPPVRRSRGRQPGRRPQASDLVALREKYAGEAMSVRQEAERLAAELNVEVSLQVIKRLRSRLTETTGPGNQAESTDR